MLAQNFKTATDLGIQEIELESLVRVLGMLERGEIKSDQFNMEVLRHPCGTPACICGWANFVSEGVAFRMVKTGCDGQRMPDWDTLPRAIKVLFSYSTMAPGADDATPGQAALALRSYLTTGNARWDEALAE
jgi:hypothetical protein